MKKKAKKKTATKSKRKPAPKKAAKRRTPANFDAIVLKRDTDVLFRNNIDGTVAVMKLDNDQFFFTIEGIAAEFWTLIDGTQTIGGIKARLIKKHSPPIDRFNKDVAKFVSQLRKEKLLTT